MKTFTPFIFGFFAFFLFSFPISAQEFYEGFWYGKVKTSEGNFPLIITIYKRGEILEGDLESPSQAPGQRLPFDVFSTGVNYERDEINFSFYINLTQTAYEGVWDEGNQQWVGTYKQRGQEFPLNLKRGEQPQRPVFKGLDGIWESKVNRNGKAFRLVLHVETGELGTQPSFASPDEEAFGLPVHIFKKENEKVYFMVKALRVAFTGILTEEGTLKGTWTVVGQSGIEITFIRNPG